MKTTANKIIAAVAVAAFTLIGVAATPADAGQPEARNVWCC